LYLGVCFQAQRESQGGTADRAALPELIEVTVVAGRVDFAGV
jgi:hypothetical protein